jgi:hypothetical protein
MGAARLGQATSDAVIVTVRRPLTWANAVTWAVWPVAHCVRIEVINRTHVSLLDLPGRGEANQTRMASRAAGWMILGTYP